MLSNGGPIGARRQGGARPPTFPRSFVPRSRWHARRLHPPTFGLIEKTRSRVVARIHKYGRRCASGPAPSLLRVKFRHCSDVHCTTALPPKAEVHLRSCRGVGRRTLPLTDASHSPSSPSPLRVGMAGVGHLSSS